MKSLRCNRNAPGCRLQASGQVPATFSFRRGFALIELLIAAILIVSAGTLLIGGLVAANRSAALRMDRAVATQALASQLALLDDTLTMQTPTEGTIPGLQDASWTLSLAEASPPLTPLINSTLTVTYHGRDTTAVTIRRSPPQE